jgi:selenocysteine lyase/cysteine desulfurase
MNNQKKISETAIATASLFHAWTAGLELLKEIGIENIHHRVIKLTDHMVQGLIGKKITITSPIDKIAERSAIITFTSGSREKNQALFEKLKARDIIISLRGRICRVSPNFFNTEAEIDKLLELLD